MPLTPNFDLPYPASTDHVRLWEHFQSLATAIDTAFARPVFRARRVAAQSINNTTDTAISWDTEDVDTHAGHDLVTNPTRYTFQVAGYSMLGGGIGWANGTTGRRKSEWWKNGSALDGSNVLMAPNSSGTVAVPAKPIIVQHSIGDYVELRGWQESGGSLGVSSAGTSSPSIDIFYIGPA